MNVASLERKLVVHLRGICKNSKLRLKDLCEWTSEESTIRKHARSDETVVFVPQMGLWTSVLSAAVKGPLAPCNHGKKS